MMSGDNGDGTGYSNANRAFLQAFIARSTFTFQEAQPVLAAILTAHGRVAGFRIRESGH